MHFEWCVPRSTTPHNHLNHLGYEHMSSPQQTFVIWFLWFVTTLYCVMYRFIRSYPSCVLFVCWLFGLMYFSLCSCGPRATVLNTAAMNASNGWRGGGGGEKNVEKSRRMDDKGGDEDWKCPVSEAGLCRAAALQPLSARRAEASQAEPAAFLPGVQISLSFSKRQEFSLCWSVFLSVFLSLLHHLIYF